MKTINLLTVVLFMSVAAMAQNNTPSTTDLGYLNKPQPQFIGTTSLGNVFAMPTDNMPCLVPFTATEGGTMPVFKTPLYQNDMPNAIPLQQLQLLPQVRINNLKLNLQPNGDSKNLMFDLLGKEKALKNPL